MRVGLTRLQLARHADAELRLGQRARLLERLQRLAGQRQLIAVRRQRQPCIGDLGDQADARRTLRFFGREILLKRRLAQIADTPEQVELERRKADIGSIDLDILRAATAGTGAGGKAGGVGESGAAIDPGRRHLIGPLHAVARPRREDVARRHAQVAVVVDALRDHRLEPWVDEEIAPPDATDVGGVCSGGRINTALRQFQRHRTGGADIFGGQIASREQCRGGQRGEDGCTDSHGQTPCVAGSCGAS